ncbi:S41 family peptidase [Asticcacaulis benevestitus]|uniref:Tail specific protease domain-containing protein n=1 Tax=Asticcacaulis benevestitus DSM 16100 = ATCC BAA-896 TaxID=1121022 RepID=V4QUE5_9CAUL|nr:S41 family peptidase [Asticcacaulis benevestitus]ESQ82788.1 hypothetical protein ABENE_20780 [Asticcacaulis benevestitus DSM 16100 = ATCC BAA-896]
MRRFRYLAFVSAVAVFVSVALSAPHIASAQPATITTPSSPVFDAAAKRQAIAAAGKLLTDDYIYPDIGMKAAALLTQNLNSGKYDAIATPASFADQLTKDLQSLTHDKHLRAFAAEPMADKPSGPPPSIGLYAFMQADRLKGNIGYIVLNGFMPKSLSRQGADKVMSLLASTDALIIDMRGNGGGDPAAVSYLVSFFFDGKTPVHVNDLIWRKPGTTDYNREVFSTEPVPTSYLNKAVYLITGPNTFSGGEEFSYDMQTLKRGTLVGEVTGGGANPGGTQPIGSGLGLFVPSGRAENPITHTSWEGTGVHPDVATAPALSFSTTYSMALRALGRPVQAAADTPEAVTEAHLLVPPRSTAAPGSEAALRKWEAGMASGHPPLEMMTEDMVKETKEDLDFVQRDLSRRGALTGVTFIRVDIGGGDVYDFAFADKSTVRFTIVLAPDSKISAVLGQPY